MSQVKNKIKNMKTYSPVANMSSLKKTGGRCPQPGFGVLRPGIDKNQEW
jgi:hypothetical protein